MRLMTLLVIAAIGISQLLLSQYIGPAITTAFVSPQPNMQLRLRNTPYKTMVEATNDDSTPNDVLRKKIIHGAALQLKEGKKNDNFTTNKLNDTKPLKETEESLVERNCTYTVREARKSGKLL